MEDFVFAVQFIEQYKHATTWFQFKNIKSRIPIMLTLEIHK